MKKYSKFHEGRGHFYLVHGNWNGIGTWYLLLELLIVTFNPQKPYIYIKKIVSPSIGKEAEDGKVK